MAAGPPFCRSWLTYSAAFLSNLGNYRSFGDTKIVPECAPSVVNSILTSSAAFAQSPAIDKLWRAVRRPMFSLLPRLQELALGPDGLSTYFSSDCSEADATRAQRFLDAKGRSGATSGRRRCPDRTASAPRRAPVPSAPRALP